MGRLGDAGAPLQPRIQSELANFLGYIDGVLARAPYLLGAEFSGADIELSFVGELAKTQGMTGPYPHLQGWLARLQARPAYQKAIARGGEYAYGK
ncbi:hypothetical protein D3C71_2057310 [compost metagenome]